MSTNIPFYDIANKFLIGFLFACGWIMMFFHPIIDFIGTNKVFQQIPTGAETILTICFVATIYEVGYLVNRISSVCSESLFIKAKMFPQKSVYSQYNDAKKIYPILSVLAAEYDFCKGHATLFILLFIASLIFCKFIFSGYFLLVAVIFILSGRKHSLRINELVKAFCDSLPNMTV